MTTSDEQKMTFVEFCQVCADEGRAPFSSVRNGDKREALHHILSAKVAPDYLYPLEGVEKLDYSKVAKRTRHDWHDLCAGALMQLLVL